ncbi:MAG: DNA adenine methylase [Nannocystaceae bacterium]
MIKYIGSKRKLLPTILRAIRCVPNSASVLDLFSGTSRVGHMLKREGFRVLSNDHNAYAHTLARCYVQADREYIEHAAEKLIAEFNRLAGQPGYFTTTFCERSRFFQPKNGARVDAIREEIKKKSLEPELESVLLVSLMEAADRVDSTCGLQMAYLKQWAPRAHNDIELRMPDVLPRAKHGKSRAFQLDAHDAARELEADVAYLDPPYNQHSYLNNYHAWESLILWDKPEVYGIACKRMDCRTRKSEFNKKRAFLPAIQQVVRDVRAKVLVVSFNNEGYIERKEMERLLETRGEVTVLTTDYKRYVGAQIGIHNLNGEKVGTVSHLRNLEYIYIVATPALGTALELPDSEEQPASCRDQLSLFGDSPPQRPVPSAAAPGRVAAKPESTAELTPDDLSVLLAKHKRLSNGDAQRLTGLPANELRALFQALVSTGVAYTTGQRRGTVYHPTETTDTSLAE